MSLTLIHSKIQLNGLVGALRKEAYVLWTHNMWSITSDVWKVWINEQSGKDAADCGGRMFAKTRRPLWNI